MPTARVTVAFPDEIVREIDRVEKNRSRIVLRALRSELDRLRQEELRKSLAVRTSRACRSPRPGSIRGGSSH